MDAKAVESWHKKLRAHPDNSREIPGVAEIDAFDRVKSGRRSRTEPYSPLAGAESFSIAELATLAELAAIYAPKTTLSSELRQEILRRNR